jgi:hypothetical protein
MRRFLQLVLSIVCLFAWAQTAQAAQPKVPLVRVAREGRLNYFWLTASGAVQLSGPGIVLVIRPGDNLYEVNDRVETTTTTPRYTGNDIYVSAALAAHIVRLAQQAESGVVSEQNAVRARAEAAIDAVRAPELHGAIVLNVAPLKGAEAVLVTGQAPPAAPVLITLLATLSSSLPNVLVSRHELQAGPDGTFQAIIPIGPDYTWRSLLNVLATSSPGVTSASAQILLHQPNEGVDVPYEEQPGGIW